MVIILEKVISILGIILSIIGAWYISRCLIKKTERDMMAESDFSYGPKAVYVFGAQKQKIEGKFGVGFLILGGLTQIIALLSPQKTIIMKSFSLTFAIPILLIIIIIIVALLIGVAEYFISKKFIKIKKNYISENYGFNEKTTIEHILKRINEVVKKPYHTSDFETALKKHNEVFGTSYSISDEE